MRTLPFLISVALTFAGCAETGKGPSQDRPGGDASLNRVLEELGPSSPTFEDRVPEEFRTALLVPAAGAGQGTEDDEAPAPNLVVDARDNGVLFPLREKPRKFGDANELDAFLLRAFGAQKNETRPQDEQQAPDHEERHSSKPQGGHGYYVVLGSTYFFDPQPGVVYRIADPLLAHLGGAYGVVMVGDQSLCVDPDEVCDATFASYLEPVGETTRLTQRQSCGRPFSDGSAVCVTHHSFWNDFTVFARWIRHGSNIRFSSYSALPSSALRVRARIFYNEIRTPTSSTRYLPQVDTVGQNSAETAAYCWGDCPLYLWNAIVVCGETRVSDPDINSTGLTGNGPGNDPTDDGFQCP